MLFTIHDERPSKGWRVGIIWAPIADAFNGWKPHTCIMLIWLLTHQHNHGGSCEKFHLHSSCTVSLNLTDGLPTCSIPLKKFDKSFVLWLRLFLGVMQHYHSQIALSTFQRRRIGAKDFRIGVDHEISSVGITLPDPLNFFCCCSVPIMPSKHLKQKIKK